MKKFIILLVIIVANNLFANRPKIGLVFSGGGARGISQIGALKVLEEAGIFPDYIAGTSVGSIIGGLYAIGYSPVQIEEIMTSQNWPQMFIDKISIKNISIEEKEDFNKYISEFPITQNRLNPPKGLVDGQMISILLSRLTSPVLNIDNFDDFYIPFRCIATDIETGETVVIKDGYLPDALQASVSIPSIFKPVEIDNKTLVDGGMSRNLPIIDVIEMGADIVIAIDTGSELFGKDKLNSFLKIMQQSINFRGIEKSVQSRKLADLIISPELDNYIITDFDKSAELIKIGEEATRKKYKDLLEIAKIQKRYSRKIKPIPNLEIDTLYINKIKYKGLKTVSKNLVIGKFKINEKSLVTFDELENGIKRLYGSKYFTRVSYKLLPRNRGFDLKIRVEESLKRGLKFSLYYDQDTNSAIHLNTTVRNFLMEGTRLKVKGKISESPSFDISYFIHTGWKPGFGITPYFRYQNYKVPVYGEKSLESKFNHHDTKIGFRFQTVYFHSMTFGIDFNYNESHSRSILSSQDMSFDVKMNQHSIFFDYDTKDNTYFPKVGSTVSLNFSDFRNVSTKNQEIEEYPQDFMAYKRFIGQFEKYFMITNKFTLFSLFKIGLIDGDYDEVPPESYVFVGGSNEHNSVLFPFMGLDYMKINALNAQTIRFGAQYNFKDYFYLKSEFDAGEASESYKNIFDSANYFYGYGITVGAITPIGPLKFTFSQSLEDYSKETYISIGFPY